MKTTIKWTSVAMAVAMANGLMITQAAADEKAGFIEGASATLSNRTINFSRDFRSSGADQSRRDETATGFVLDFQSGYSHGAIGIGADVLALGGIKLDGGEGQAETGLLPSEYDVTSGPTEYAEIRGAVKVRVAGDTEFRYGVHRLENPIITFDDSRLLPSHYNGYSVTNTSIDGLFLEAGRMNDRSEMNSSSQTRGAFEEKEKVTYLGGSYEFSDNLSTSLYTSKADELFKRHFLGLTHTLPLAGELSLTSDVAYYHTSDENSANDEFDNKAASVAFTLGAGHHGFTLAYQRMSGDAGFNYYDFAIYLANSIQYADFNAKDERSWQARYDYDFEGLGIPGLTFMTRYIRGSNIDTDFEGLTAGRDTRWERNTNIGYTIQGGALEGVNLLWRNATVRQDIGFDGDVDENRLIVSYTWDLL